MDERRERDETMWRENRRIQAMSWCSNGSDDPPPKPSRVPAALISANAGTSGRTAAESTSGPTTYLVAPNSQVLAQLMRDNGARTDAGMYTAPASAFNTFTVEFVPPSTDPSVASSLSPQHQSKARSRKIQPKNQPEYANLLSARGPASQPGPQTAASQKDVRLA